MFGANAVMIICLMKILSLRGISSFHIHLKGQCCDLEIPWDSQVADFIEKLPEGVDPQTGVSFMSYVRSGIPLICAMIWYGRNACTRCTLQE